MVWPPDEIWSRIAGMWRHAYGPPGSNEGERANALAALRQHQKDFELTDCQVAFIAERHALDPSSRAIKRERAPNAFEVSLGVLDEAGLVMPFEFTVVSAVWCLHTYVFTQFLHTPRLFVHSRGSGYGKTALLSCVAGLANHSRYVIAPSAAVLYRWLEADPWTTYVIDNAENSALWDTRNVIRQVYEAGHRQGAPIPRVNGREVVWYPTNSPLSLGTIIDRARRQRIPAQITNRSIALEMTKSIEGQDEIFPNDLRFAPARAVSLQWAETFRRPTATISLPRGLVARCGNNWRALAAVGDALGYGATLRAAAVAVEAASFDLETRLYEDIYQVFERRQTDRVWTHELVLALREMEHGAWAALTNDTPYDRLYGEGLDYRSVWIVGADGKRRSSTGFMRAQFEPVWRKLFGHVEAQSSRIIRLSKHKQSTGETQDDD